MTYRTSQPYNNCSNGTKPYFSGCKQLFIPDRCEHYHNPYSYHNFDPLLSYYNQHHSECNPFYKHNCVPYQADCRPYYHHGHDPYYGNNHGHDTASWYHAHDSGNTVVLNVPPYWTVGTRTGIGTGITETIKQGSAQDLGYGSTTGNDLL